MSMVSAHMIGRGGKDSHGFVCLITQHPRSTEAASSAAVLGGDGGWRDTSEAVASKRQSSLPRAKVSMCGLELLLLASWKDKLSQLRGVLLLFSCGL